MSFTLSIGWWAVPAIVTVAAFLVALKLSPSPQHSYGPIPDIGAAFATLLLLLGAVIVSLAAWLIWAVLS